MYEISNINDLPSIPDVLRRAKGFALLDAIIMPDWSLRYFSFDIAWNLLNNESMASIRNGSGSECFIIFSPEGAVGKVFDADLDGNVFDRLRDVPSRFNSFKSENAFNLKDATFYFWRRKDDANWSAIPENCKYFSYLNFFVVGIELYHKWAELYYERPLDFVTCKEIFESLEVDEEKLSRINPYLTMENVASDLAEILGI